MIKPDFLIIGSMKSGTTSLHHYLSQHPDICMSEPKEVHIFDKNFSVGDLKTYAKVFKHKAKVYGTSPQNYTKTHLKKYSCTPELIKSYLPNVKLIYIIRKPVDRIVSHYFENIEGKGINMDFKKFYYKNKSHLINTSSYYSQILKYEEFFPKNQIMIIKFDDLISQPTYTLERVFAFLEVDHCYNIKYDRVNSKETKRMKPKLVISFINFINRYSKYLKWAFTLKKILNIEFSFGQYINKIKGKKITVNLNITEEIKNDINKNLNKDFENLEKNYNINLENWK